LSWVLALEARLRELPPAGRALAIAAGLPSVALLVAALADMLAAHDDDPEPAVVPVRAATASAQAPASVPAPACSPAPASAPAIPADALRTAVRAGEIALGAATSVA